MSHQKFADRILGKLRENERGRIERDTSRTKPLRHWNGESLPGMAAARSYFERKTLAFVPLACAVLVHMVTSISFGACVVFALLGAVAWTIFRFQPAPARILPFWARLRSALVFQGVSCIPLVSAAVLHELTAAPFFPSAVFCSAIVVICLGMRRLGIEASD